MSGASPQPAQDAIESILEKNAEGAAVAPEIEGTWLVTITIQDEDGTPPFASLASYARGGALIVTDSLGAPATGNVYQGAWTKTGRQKYTFTFLGFRFDASGVLSGYIRVHETVQLQGDGMGYDGVGTVEILDTNQNVVTTINHTTHATRVNAG